jgi:hypothetical protein
VQAVFPAIGKSINHLNNQWSYTLEGLDPEDQSLWKITRRVMIPTPSPPCGHTRGTCSLTPRKPNPLQSLEAQFQPVNYPLELAVIEVVNEMRT